jgi:hypothetical protein
MPLTLRLRILHTCPDDRSYGIVGVYNEAGYVINANKFGACCYFHQSPSRCHFQCMRCPLTGESMLGASDSFGCDGSSRFGASYDFYQVDSRVFSRVIFKNRCELLLNMSFHLQALLFHGQLPIWSMCMSPSHVLRQRINILIEARYL